MWRESQWAELRDLKVNPHQTSLFAYAGEQSMLTKMPRHIFAQIHCIAAQLLRKQLAQT